MAKLGQQLGVKAPGNESLLKYLVREKGAQSLYSGWAGMQWRQSWWVSRRS